MAHPVQAYNRILGVQHIESAAQLKHAYRRQAKIFHPDSNKNPHSHEQFILLHEAYEFYSHLLARPADSTYGEVASKRYPEHYYRDIWQAEMRKEARRQAAEKARMRNAVFEQKGYFRLLDKMYHFITFLRIVQALALLVGLPVFIFFQDGFRGLISVMVVQFFTYPLWSPYIRMLFNRARSRRSLF